MEKTKHKTQKAVNDIKDQARCWWPAAPRPAAAATSGVPVLPSSRAPADRATSRAAQQGEPPAAGGLRGVARWMG